MTQRERDNIGILKEEICKEKTKIKTDLEKLKRNYDLSEDNQRSILRQLKENLKRRKKLKM